MNTLRISAIAVAFTLAVSAAQAGSLPDPKILIAGSGYSQTVYELNFSFGANATGGGSFDFFNSSGIDWAELNLATAMPYGYVDDVWRALDSSLYYDIQSDLFASSALSFGTNGLAIRFYGLDESHPGIPSAGMGKLHKSDNDPGGPPWGSHFSINLDNPGTPGEGGWLGANRDPLSFDAAAAPVPEPATFALLFGGLLAIGLRYRRR